MRKLAAALTALALLGAGCSGGDEADATPIVPSVQTTAVDELASVFPLPSGEVTVLSPYTEVEDEALCTETVIFSVVGPGADAMMEYYDRLLTNMGYVVDEADMGADAPLGAQAFEISDPVNEDFTGIIRVEPDGDGALRLAHERTRLKG